MRILLVDDDERITSFVGRALTAKGLPVDCASDGTKALALARTGIYSLIVLDLMLPGLDGKALLRQIMESVPDQPVLILSAFSDVKTKVECLQMGAADYLTKPFSLQELLGRVRARLRDPCPASVSATAAIRLDPFRRVAHVPEGAVRLSQKEFLVLQHLIERDGAICTRQELLADVWGYWFDPGSNVVDVCIRRLRAKLGHRDIETVRNLGYRLSSTSPLASAESRPA
jgi:two-component system, OmpR family, response regulator